MKRILTFLAGLTLGFILAGPLPGSRSGDRRSLQSPSDTDASALAVDARNAEESGLREQTDSELVPIPDASILPASARPAVFDIRGVGAGYLGSRLDPWNRERLPREILDNPGFEPLLRRALQANLRENLAGYRKLIPLNDAQFDALVNLGVDQAIDAFNADPENMPTSTERSDAGKERLAEFLTEDQIERFAKLKIADTFPSPFELGVELPAKRGLTPLTVEQLDRLLVPDTWQYTNPRMPQDTYATLNWNIRTDDPSLTDAQRNYLSELRQYRDDFLLLSSVRGASVRDPDVWEIWPED